MQIVIDLLSFIIGVSFGGLIIWLLNKTRNDKEIKRVSKRKNDGVIDSVLRLERGLFLAYDLLKWFKRPNKKRDEEDSKSMLSRDYKKLFTYFLKNRLIQRVSEEEDETYCLTEEGKVLCDMLDEISEELEIPIKS
jgi:hypothetical protein